MIEMLRTLAREQGRAVVIVTHDIRILPFADRLVHIEDGAIKEDTATLHEITRLQPSPPLRERVSREAGRVRGGVHPAAFEAALRHSR